MEEKLKPCPFCGSVVIGKDKTNCGCFAFYFICCKKCGAKSAYYQTKNSAIDAWNKRS